MRNKHKEPHLLCASRNNTIATVITPSERIKIPISVMEHYLNQEAISFEMLYKSMQKCKKNVLWKGSVQSYYLNGLKRTYALEEKINKGEYTPHKPTRFEVTRPKRREILSITFRDRVYQRALNDEYIYPMITKHLIYDNAACQKGKGTDFARDRYKHFLRKMYRKHGREFYILQCDIKGYYPNMRHEVVEELFDRHLDPEVSKLAKETLNHQYAGDVGYIAGSQMVQIAGIGALNDMDHWIKEKLRVRCYIRYMDDFILFYKDEKHLEQCRDKIETYLGQMGFRLNLRKTKIMKADKPNIFLGFEFTLSDTGKVYMHVDPKKVKAKRRNLTKMIAKAKRGEIDKRTVDESYETWKAHANHGNSFKMLQRMDKWYKDQWKEPK